MNAPLSAPQQEHAYLSRLGERVRAWRTEHGMTRKALSLACGVSERYLAQLESGRGNISVLLLRKVARAMGVAVEHLVREEQSAARSGRIALIGLRGAGKSTLGGKLAHGLGLPFVELDREVEKEAGAKLGEVFAMCGEDAFRRFERRALQRVLHQNERAVIAAGGSLVPGYKLKLNSYDLGADIELHKALNRIRFEHPAVKAVVITSGKSRIFCSGANSYILGTSSQAWNVNFCKFTNETPNATEDSSA